MRFCYIPMTTRQMDKETLEYIEGNLVECTGEDKNEIVADEG